MHKPWTHQRQVGFTIVELLIVIVIIGILAAISIVAYNGIQNRANDTAVQSDLRNIGGKLSAYLATEGTLPMSVAAITSLGAKATTSAYGNHFNSSPTLAYNLAYCIDTVARDKFSLVAASKSGNVYVFKEGGVSSGVGPMQTAQITCTNNGVTTNPGAYWMYSANAWQYGLAT